MKTRKQKETGEKEVHLLEQKGYERMVNEIVPVQQAEAYRKPTNKAVKEAVKELNPDTNSLGSRGITYPLLPRLFVSGFNSLTASLTALLVGLRYASAC